MNWNFLDTLNPAASFELVEQKNLQINSDDAEAAPDPWDKKGFTVSTARAHAGSQSYYGGIADNLDNRLTSSEHYDVQAGDSLTFWTWYNTELNWDYAYVEISTNNGQSFLPFRAISPPILIPTELIWAMVLPEVPVVSGSEELST